MRFVFALCLSLPSLMAVGQQFPAPHQKGGGVSEKGDSTYRPKIRYANYYLGVQANQLLNQLFNFGNTTAAVNNPYMLIFSVNSKRTGWGFNSGLGYNISTSSDDSNPQAVRKTNSNSFNLRAGPERKIYITEKWLASFGLDLAYSRVSANTKVSSTSGFSTTSNETTSTANAFGGGLRGGLSYFIAGKILLGTEVTYYYFSAKTKQEDTSTFINVDPNTGVITAQSSGDKSDFKSTSLTLRTPISVFLILKL